MTVGSSTYALSLALQKVTFMCFLCEYLGSSTYLRIFSVLPSRDTVRGS